MRLKRPQTWTWLVGAFILLKGARKRYWSVWVSGNWRVTLRFRGNDTTDVDYEDYH